jgi:hypothetical protein
VIGMHSDPRLATLPICAGRSRLAGEGSGRSDASPIFSAVAHQRGRVDRLPALPATRRLPAPAPRPPRAKWGSRPIRMCAAAQMKSLPDPVASGKKSMASRRYGAKTRSTRNRADEAKPVVPGCGACRVQTVAGLEQWVTSRGRRIPRACPWRAVQRHVRRPSS